MMGAVAIPGCKRTAPRGKGFPWQEHREGILGGACGVAHTRVRRRAAKAISCDAITLLGV